MKHGRHHGYIIQVGRSPGKWCVHDDVVTRFELLIFKLIDHGFDAGREGSDMEGRSLG